MADKLTETVERLIPSINREVDRRTANLIAAILPIYEAYSLNDCDERSPDGALEISIMDLRALVDGVNALDSREVAGAALSRPNVDEMREALEGISGDLEQIGIIARGAATTHGDESGGFQMIDGYAGDAFTKARAALRGSADNGA